LIIHDTKRSSMVLPKNKKNSMMHVTILWNERE